MLKCPACGSPHDKMYGLFIHMRNSKDENHLQYDSTETIEKALADGLDVKESFETEDNDTGKDAAMISENEKEASSMFDEPSTGKTVSQEVELPCGHESINPDDIPAGKSVICEVCGNRFEVKT
jgi:hypothetical protein